MAIHGPHPEAPKCVLLGLAKTPREPRVRPAQKGRLEQASGHHTPIDVPSHQLPTRTTGCGTDCATATAAVARSIPYVSATCKAHFMMLPPVIPWYSHETRQLAQVGRAAQREPFLALWWL